ncbi:hypothetical protein [Lutispora sp.]|uniref:hypothetical protein n=1 Tax=Lutispora sp. TaxID=2828727 RepID=UPI003563818B
MAVNISSSKVVQETGDAIRYQYDAVGNLIKMTAESGLRTYDYDENNLLKEIVKNGVTEISYTYDKSTGWKRSHTEAIPQHTAMMKRKP